MSDKITMEINGNVKGEEKEILLTFEKGKLTTCLYDGEDIELDFMQGEFGLKLDKVYSTGGFRGLGMTPKGCHLYFEKHFFDSPPRIKTSEEIFKHKYDPDAVY